VEVSVTGKWCPGRVSKENRNGTFNVELDDGDNTDNVKQALIRESVLTKSTAPPVFKLRSRVVVSVEQRGVTTWYEKLYNQQYCHVA
jgi:hypothetical protein